MALKEFMGSRADATDAKNSLYNQIATYGYASLSDMPNDLSKKTTLNTINTYLLAAGIANDLMDDSDRLTIDTFRTEDLEMSIDSLIPLNEVSNFVDKADMYMNLNMWKKQPGSNILYVLGLSGSGKSTISNSLKEKYKAEVIELDAIEQKKTQCTPKEQALIKLAESEFPAYEAAGYDILENMGPIAYPAYTRKTAMPVIKYIIEEVLYKENALYIVEGIQMFEAYQPNQLVDKPCIFKNTSTLQSILRRMKRNNDGVHIDWTKELRLSLLSNSLWMAASANRLEKYSRAAEKHAKENGGEIMYKKEEEVKPEDKETSKENIEVEGEAKDKETKKDDKMKEKEGEK